MSDNLTLSLIVPVFFEEECIVKYIEETTDVLQKEAISYEMVFVDDGSTDRTVALIKENCKTNKNIKLIELSYNHGKQAALTAGIHHSKGEFLLMMDPDLQDPPDKIPEFLHKISEGYDLVFGIREEKKDKLINVIFSKIFWWTLEKFTGLKIPKGLAVMRIFNRKFANQFMKYNEASRFIEGIFMHIGMRMTTMTIPQRERFAGTSKYNFRRKMGLALNAIFDFSDVPLRMAVQFGLALVLLSLLGVFFIFVAKLFIVDFQLGWASVMVTLIFGFGVQTFFLGIVGIYIGKTYKEAKNRPLFSIKEITNL